MTRTRIGIHDSCSRVIDPALDALFKSVATSASEMGFVECIVMQMTMRARHMTAAARRRRLRGGYKHHSTRAAEFLRAVAPRGEEREDWRMKEEERREGGFIIIFVRGRRMHLLQPT